MKPTAWLDPMNNAVPSDMVTASGSMSTLTFNPLSASHAGTYTCRATVKLMVKFRLIRKQSLYRVSVDEHSPHRLDTDYSLCHSFLLSDPPITVRVDTGVAIPMAGSMYSLTCTVTGTERLTGSIIIYQWLKDGVVVSSQIMETFSSLLCPSLILEDTPVRPLSCPLYLVDPSATVASSNSVDVTLTCKYYSSC